VCGGDGGAGAGRHAAGTNASRGGLPRLEMMPTSTLPAVQRACVCGGIRKARSSSCGGTLCCIQYLLLHACCSAAPELGKVLQKWVVIKVGG
jgi:hypothetical protein